MVCGSAVRWWRCCAVISTVHSASLGNPHRPFLRPQGGSQVRFRRHGRVRKSSRNRFGSSPTDVLRMCGYGGESLDCAVAAASWYLVQINAACDDGSQDPGYLPYCLAATVPTKRLKDGESVRLKANQTRKGSVEKTRKVELQEGEERMAFPVRNLCDGP